jgi:hypothetical protein
MSSGQFFDSRYPRLPATPQAQAEQLLRQKAEAEAESAALHMLPPRCENRWGTLHTLIHAIAPGQENAYMQDFEVGLLILLKEEWLAGRRSEQQFNLNLVFLPISEGKK